MEWEWDLGAFVSCASRCVRLWADSFVGGVLLAMICRLRTSEEFFLFMARRELITLFAAS